MASLMKSYWLHDDRGLKRLKIRHFLLLIFSILGLNFSFFSAKSQKSNELVFDSLVVDFLRQHPYRLDSLEGFFTEDLQQKIPLENDGAYRLNVEAPEIGFVKVQGKKYQRKISTVLTFTDSTEQAFSISYQDTIDRSMIRPLRKSKHLELRGRDPRWATNYLLPSLIIGTGIAGIISLFYIRSS